MYCFMCGRPAASQCPICRRFYCPHHGGRRCVECTRSAVESGALPFQTTDASLIIVSETQSLEPVRSGSLQRTIAVGAQQECQGLILSLISIEVYDDGFVANFRLAVAGPPKSAEQLPGVMPILTASATESDNVVYFAYPRPAMGPPGDWYASLRFAPPLRDTSRYLTIAVIKIEWLPRQPSSKIIEWLGPWTFEVTLIADAPC